MYMADVTCDDDFMYSGDVEPRIVCDEATVQWNIDMEGECKQRIWRTDVVRRLTHCSNTTTTNNNNNDNNSNNGNNKEEDF